MHFTDLKDPGFCESIIWTPEYINCITSFAMLCTAAFGLFLNRTHNQLIIAVWSCFFSNFIGSFGFHYSLYQGWGLVDTCSMVCAAYLGMYVIYTLLLELLVTNRTITYYLSAVFQIMSIFMLVMSLADRCLDNFIGFNTVIAIPFIAIILGSTLQAIKISFSDIPNVIRNYLLTGIISVTLSSIVWLLTEPFCYTKDTRLAYTFSHGIWHTFVSYGFYLIGVCQIYIHGYNRRKRSDLIYTFDHSGFFFIFPRTTYSVQHERTITI